MAGFDGMILLTRYGMREWLGGAIIAILLVALLAAVFQTTGRKEFLYPVPVVALVWLAVAAFFRDPSRVIPLELESIVSPADGVVRDIETVEAFEHSAHFNEGRAVRVGIFLSVLDVHLNRAPCGLTVKGVVHKDGEYHDARDKRASSLNESNSIICSAASELGGFPLVVKQITGAIARRIVCAVGEGNALEKGQRYGMIKFGSRTELYLPAGEGIDILAKVGDRVYAGATIVAKVRNSRKEVTE